MMVVGLLVMELSIPGAMSLKEKRRAVKSLKDRLGRHNVSVAEVGKLDLHRRCDLAVSQVSNDRRFCDECLSKLVDEVRRDRGVVLMTYEIEWL
jgi:hypothetical protein